MRIITEVLKESPAMICFIEKDDHGYWFVVEDQYMEPEDLYFYSLHKTYEGAHSEMTDFVISFREGELQS